MKKSSSKARVMTEEELKLFLEKNKKIKLWGDQDIPEWTKRADSIGKEEGYTLDFKDDTGVTVESKVMENGTMEVRSRIPVQGQSARVVYDFLLDYDYAWDYDNMMGDFKVLHQISEFQSMNVYQSKAPIRWIVSPRDFIYISFRKPLENGNYIILLKGVEYDGYPELKGIVRGWIHYTIYYVKPHPENEGDSIVFYLTNSDGKGMIPKKITNYLTRKLAPSWIKNLKKYIRDYPEYLKKLKEKEEEVEGEN